MEHMSFKEIAATCGGIYYGDDESYHKEVSAVVIDSRKTSPGCLFVAVRGARTDGHMFIPQAVSGGALGAISEKRLDNVSFPYILVHSSLQALKDIAEYYRSTLNIRVVGISGSVGKTSTKEMIASVLGQKYNVLKTEGNFNNEIGLPLTIFRIRREHQIAVLEMGISDFGEMERLAKIARPDLCVLTNIGSAHLEQLKSRDGILKAKTEMFRYMDPEGAILLNGDDDKLSQITRYGQITPVFFGLSENADVYADHIVPLGLEGTSCTIHIKGEAIENVRIPIPGAHMVYNALAAAAAGHALSLTCEEIRKGIASCVPIAGRNNLLKKNGLAIIDDCYNANPASMKSSLDVLAYAGTRKVAILGDMGELGDTQEIMHREIGQYAAAKGVDLLCCIGELSRHMYEGALFSPGWQGKAVYFPSKKEFFTEMPHLIQPGDTILVKASHFMEFPEIVEKLQED